MSEATQRLLRAKQDKRDEFYTQLEDIEKELGVYDFERKTVYCNCDGPASNFWWYFRAHFFELGLSGLIATAYSPGHRCVKWVAYPNGEVRQFRLMGSGDFRSQECIDILNNEANVVVTNPPFSLLGSYLALLWEWGGEFIIVGQHNAFLLKDLFMFTLENKWWTGHSKRNRGMWFHIPQEYQDDGGRSHQRYKKGEAGHKLLYNGMACWMTNMEYPGRLDRQFACPTTFGSRQWSTYDNYPAIDVPTIRSIPGDYDGIMGVPVTMLYYLNPKQFVIVGGKNGCDGDDLTLHGHRKFNRLLIRRRRHDEPVIGAG